MSTPRSLYCCLILLFIALIFLTTTINAQQNLLPPNQPEQDACTALDLCGSTFFTPYGYQGNGNTLDIPNTQWGEGEVNALWARVNILTAGKLVFKITPVKAEDDYDFAVINATGINCNSITTNNIVRVNFNNDYAGSNYMGTVGLSDTATQSFIETGVYGYSFVKAIDALPGETYLVMVNNFGTYGQSNEEGFTIDFTGSTVNFKQIEPPVISNINNPCSQDSFITLHFSEPVLCNSIAPDGSDFNISPPIIITHAQGDYCLPGGYTNAVKLYFSGSLIPTTQYNINFKQGIDTNTMFNLCETSLSLSFRTSFVSPGVNSCISFFYAPTAFTPNSDRLNDVFKPSLGGDISEYKLTVYNRYGQIIFKSNQLNKGWDGTLNALQQPPGTYVWICNYTSPEGDRVMQKGKVVLCK